MGSRFRVDSCRRSALRGRHDRAGTDDRRNGVDRVDFHLGVDRRAERKLILAGRAPRRGPPLLLRQLPEAWHRRLLMRCWLVGCTTYATTSSPTPPSRTLPLTRAKGT